MSIWNKESTRCCYFYLTASTSLSLLPVVHRRRCPSFWGILDPVGAGLRQIANYLLTLHNRKSTIATINYPKILGYTQLKGVNPVSIHQAHGSLCCCDIGFKNGSSSFWFNAFWSSLPGCSCISRDTMVLTSYILAHKITVLEYKFNDSWLSQKARKRSR